MSSETEQPPAASPPRPRGRRHRRRPRWWSGPLKLTAAFVAAAALVILAGMSVTGRSLSAPGWIVGQVEARANAALGGQAMVSVGAIEMIVDDRFVPRVRMTGVTLFAPSGARLAQFPDVRAVFDPAALTAGRIEPRSLRIAGATVALRRLADGSFDVPQATAGAAVPQLRGPAELSQVVMRAFDAPGLRGLARIEVADLSISFDDARAGQRLDIAKGSLTVTQSADDLRIALGFAIADPGGRPGKAALEFVARRNSPEARLVATLEGVRAATLAAQSPAFAWAAVLDAPVSGRFTSGIDAAGKVEDLHAALTIGAGALRPDPAAPPVPFRHAALSLDYDPARGALKIEEIELDSATLRARGGAKAWLKGLEGGFPTALVGQIGLAEIIADPAGLFDDPVGFSQGAIDFKLELAPFSLRIGQFSLSDGKSRILAKGEATVTDGRWAVRFDAGVDRIDSGRLLSIWPTALVPRTRDWYRRNVTRGELHDLQAAFRAEAGGQPRFTLGYDFTEAEVRVLAALPPVFDGAGHATIFDNVYTQVLDHGRLIAPKGGEVDVAGSVLEVPDIRKIPADAVVTLKTQSSISAALSLLDEPPFRFISKAGQKVDIAEGRAELTSLLKFSLGGNLKPGDVEFDLNGTLHDVASDRIVPGRPLRAVVLTVRATPAGIRIGGEGTLSGVRFRGGWEQGFGPEAAGKSRVAASVELSQRFLDAFSIGLPAGTLKGEGLADVTVDLARGEAARFQLTSDLDRVTLSVPGIGWTKPASRTGRFEAGGTLGTPPEVEAMTLDAAGLSFTGSVAIRPDGRLDRVKLNEVKVADWFRGSAEIQGTADGKGMKLAVTSGTLDLSRSAFGGGGGGLPISAALDRVRVAEGLDLTGFEGFFSSDVGFNGTFTARVNGQAAISGTAVPLEKGTGFRIRSDDAGAVFAAGGMFSRGRGGTLEATIRPDGRPGHYNGDLSIGDIRVVDAPVLAELLGAISVVGLLEQLNGSGILFSNVRGSFRIQPGAVEITQGSAIGASLGVSGAGVYDRANAALDLRGTISPIYLFNGIGQIVSRQREGLFGFNYRISGPVDAPRISVNPLSILTPGLFRELFRTQPPTLEPRPPVVRSRPPEVRER
ncbi:MAG: AsmA-like C-terminal region-containing protein [Paracoccaceae bacterium]